MALKYRFNLKDIKLQDFKVYLVAMFKGILPKKKIKNRETAIGRRIKAIEIEIDTARALVQNKKNQDNYQLLLKETEKIDKLEIEYLELLEEKESLFEKIKMI